MPTGPGSLSSPSGHCPVPPRQGRRWWAGSASITTACDGPCGLHRGHAIGRAHNCAAATLASHTASRCVPDRSNHIPVDDRGVDVDLGRTGSARRPLGAATARAILDVAVFFGPVFTGTTTTMIAPVTLLGLRERAGIPFWLALRPGRVCERTSGCGRISLCAAVIWCPSNPRLRQTALNVVDSRKDMLDRKRVGGDSVLDALGGVDYEYLAAVMGKGSPTLGREQNLSAKR